MREIAQFVAALACSLFAGAAVYINLVEHPARTQCGVELAATEFAPSYRRGTVMQATCAAVGLLSSLAAWLAGATVWWLIAGVLLGLVIPFTLIVILPTNKRLLSPALDRGSAEAERLLTHLGEAARCAERPQRFGAAPFPVFGDLQEGYLRTEPASYYSSSTWCACAWENFVRTGNDDAESRIHQWSGSSAADIRTS